MSRFPLSLCAALLVAGAATAQDTDMPLEVGVAHADSLSAEEVDRYSIELDADHFVYGEADQQTVDVVITVYDPEGTVVRTVDGPAAGPERFQFDSEAAGRYRIEVEPAEAAAGRYAIVLRRVEPVAMQPAERVDQIMAAYSGDDVPGGVVGVVENGRLVFSEGYGMANLAYDLPFTTETRSNIGSTSKQFTAAAIVLLDRRGALSLDDDIRAHVPELPDFGDTIRIRNLLTHTSGYREFLNTVALAGRRLDEGDYIDRQELIEIVQRQPELQNEPGAEWNYNNTGFGLLSMVVERVTGQSFPKWMEENVFGPLGMEHTLVRPHPRDIVRNSSEGYVPAEDGGYRETTDLGAAMGAGTIYTTAADLAKWIRNFETEELGGPGFFETMTTRYVLTDGDTTDYALGLFVDEFRGLRRVHHGGADVAHRAMLRYYPEIDAGVVVLSNNATFDSGSISNAVAEAFFADHLEPEGGPAMAAAEDAAFDPAHFDPERFDDYAGRYALEEAPGFVLEFTREDDELFLQATGQPKAQIVPTSDSTFAVTVAEASITFHRTADGAVESLTLHQNGDHVANRLEEEGWTPAPEDLAAYTGRYFSEELATFYTIVLEDEQLVLRHRRFEDVELEPAEEKDAFTGGFPVAQLEFQRDEAGQVTGLTVGNGRTRDVHFEKLDPDR